MRLRDVVDLSEKKFSDLPPKNSTDWKEISISDFEPQTPEEKKQGHSELSESWREKAAALALATGLTVSTPLALKHLKSTGQSERSRSVATQIPAQPNPKISNPKLLTNSELEKSLRDYLIQQGIQGTELSAFLAQARVETKNFTTLRETGERSYFRRYENKKSLGNNQPGDGWKYRGRNFLQTTGRWNYNYLKQKLGVDVLAKPDLLADDRQLALKSSVLIWRLRTSDVENFRNTKWITRKITGAEHPGEDQKLAERSQYFLAYEKSRRPTLRAPVSKPTPDAKSTQQVKQSSDKSRKKAAKSGKKP